MDSSLAVTPDGQTCEWIAGGLTTIQFLIRGLKEGCVVQTEVDSEEKSDVVEEGQEDQSTSKIHCDGVLQSRNLSFESDLQLEVAP